jgi:hypothetical protein
LVELLIVITLVALLATGMLMAMRISLTTLEKVENRLEENRRSMAIQQMIRRQIGGVIPVLGACGAPGGPAVVGAVFRGTPDSLRLVTSYSMMEGARGYPQAVEYQVVPEPGGRFRLIMHENPYGGPFSIASFCGAPAEGTQKPVVLAEKLAYCRILYHESTRQQLDGGNWLPVWDRPNLPSAVRIEMASAEPNPARLPVVTLHIPIHVTRDVLGTYVDY